MDFPQSEIGCTGIAFAAAIKQADHLYGDADQAKSDDTPEQGGAELVSGCPCYEQDKKHQ